MSKSIHLPDRTHLLNAFWQFQNEKGYISDEDIDVISEALNLSRIEVEGVISFYHFFHRQPAGKFIIYLNDSVTSELSGYQAVRSAFCEATGAPWNGVDPTGQFGLFGTSCIGLCDHEPAALINFMPFVNLTPQKVKALIWQLRRGVPTEELADKVQENLRRTPPPERTILMRPFNMGATLRSLQELSPEEVLKSISDSGLCGMGGAFFPSGLKWEACHREEAKPKYVVCNADEGEPGTFKDRLLLHTCPGLIIEGMITAAYAIGASQGIIYLRAEYRWLLPVLEAAIEQYRKTGWLGDAVPTHKPFAFDIRVQLGAGAYVCGEETALLQSMEGERGEPRVKTFFPVERGFLGKPTLVSNVETFSAAARIIELGAKCFRGLGTPSSPGTRLLSVSGDCKRPGVYEIEWGESLGNLLDWCEAEDPWAVQISGPSGQLIRADRRRHFDKSDLRCGGAVTIFNSQRDLLTILRNYAKFFRRESCGVCTPCRAGNYIFSRKLDKLSKGLGNPNDQEEIRNWSRIMQQASRCGLGKTSTNSLLSAMEEFPDYFAGYFGEPGDRQTRPFDLEKATAAYRKIVNS